MTEYMKKIIGVAIDEENGVAQFIYGVTQTENTDGTSITTSPVLSIIFALTLLMIIIAAIFTARHLLKKGEDVHMFDGINSGVRIGLFLITLSALIAFSLTIYRITKYADEPERSTISESVQIKEENAPNVEEPIHFTAIVDMCFIGFIVVSLFSFTIILIKKIKREHKNNERRTILSTLYFNAVSASKEILDYDLWCSDFSCDNIIKIFYQYIIHTIRVSLEIEEEYPNIWETTGEIVFSAIKPENEGYVSVSRNNYVHTYECVNTTTKTFKKGQAVVVTMKGQECIISRMPKQKSKTN